MLLNVKGSAAWTLIVSLFLPFILSHPRCHAQPHFPEESIQLTATSAQSVRLVMALSEAGSSLCCEVVRAIPSLSVVS